MCGRFTLISSVSHLQLRFGLAMEPAGARSRYNIAPTQLMSPVVNNARSEGPDCIAPVEPGRRESNAEEVRLFS